MSAGCRAPRAPTGRARQCRRLSSQAMTEKALAVPISPGGHQQADAELFSQADAELFSQAENTQTAALSSQCAAGADGKSGRVQMDDDAEPNARQTTAVTAKTPTRAVTVGKSPLAKIFRTTVRTAARIPVVAGRVYRRQTQTPRRLVAGPVVLEPVGDRLSPGEAEPEDRGDDERSAPRPADRPEDVRLRGAGCACRAVLLAHSFSSERRGVSAGSVHGGVGPTTLPASPA